MALAPEPAYAAAPAVTAIVPDHQRDGRRRVSWGAIFAGVAVALVVQLVLNILGVGLGASTLDAANTADNPSASGFSITAAAWIVGSGILASLAGGAAAGRLCGAADGNTARWHGLVSWAVTTMLIFYMLTTAVGGVLGGAFNALGSTVSAAGRGAASAVSGAAQAADGNALQAQVRRLVNPNDAQTAQDDVLAYIRDSISGDQGAADAARQRAVDAIARTANISPDDARARLQQAEQQARQAADQAKQKAQAAAEATRKGLASAGLLGTVALLLGAAAAWFGGGLGAPRREAVSTRSI